MGVTAKWSGKSQALTNRLCLVLCTACGKGYCVGSSTSKEKGAELRCAVNTEEEEVGGSWCVWMGTPGKQCVLSCVRQAMADGTVLAPLA